MIIIFVFLSLEYKIRFYSTWVIVTQQCPFACLFIIYFNLCLDYILMGQKSPTLIGLKFFF